MQQIDIKKLLALVTVVFFFAVILLLFFVQIPSANLDMFKTFGVTLIAIASGVAGYYFGSSDGSARKTELLGLPPDDVIAMDLPPKHPDQAGFIRLPALMALLAIAALFTLSGCATTSIAPAAKDSPQILAGKSLLAAKSTIVTAATVTDRLCKSGAMPADKCLEARAAYELSKPAFDAAVDAYLLLTVSGGGDPGDFAGALLKLQGSAAKILQLTGGAQ